MNEYVDSMTKILTEKKTALLVKSDKNFGNTQIEKKKIGKKLKKRKKKKKKEQKKLRFAENPIESESIGSNIHLNFTFICLVGDDVHSEDSVRRQFYDIFDNAP